MTREDAINKLKELYGSDIEYGHHAADEVLCKLLSSLGYDDVVDAWRDVKRWYS